MTSPARPYRFPPVPEDDTDATRCTAQSCGTCGASAVASCVALCCCPCAVVSCLTMALVRAPYFAGRRCVVRLADRRLRKRKARRVRDLDDGGHRGEVGKAAAAAGLPRKSREWDQLSGAAVVGGGAECRARVLSSRMDASEKVWLDMYQVGLWGFGRLSVSAPVAAGGEGGGESKKEDGDGTAE